jgi:peroxidase
MQWGQFINHDMEDTPTWSYGNGTSINCCQMNKKGVLEVISADSSHPSCLAIPVDSTDRFYNDPAISTYCMNFVRSISGPRNNCSLGYADQLNQNTHWLDGSTVYGSTNETMNTLRSFRNGQLLMSNLTGRQLLPISPACNNSACFYAGDSRATEQPQLAVMHTIWAREHNRVAAQLLRLNPTWTDETVFQEARRIVVAEIQRITYDEWLPNLINSTYLSQYGLLSSAPGFFTGYSTPHSSGPISNEFATAAFRMGHSMVQGTVQ